MLPIPYCQNHTYWCSGKLKSQGISGHGIDPQIRNIPSAASGELSILRHVYLGAIQQGRTWQTHSSKRDYCIWSVNKLYTDIIDETEALPFDYFIVIQEKLMTPVQSIQRHINWAQ